MRLERVWLPLLLGAAIEACLLGIRRIQPEEDGVYRLWLWMLPAFISYACIVFIGCRQRAGRWSAPVIMVLACVFRLTLLADEPWLSDDIYRYVWDGRTQSAGINPYRYRPADAELEHLRDAAYTRVNHRDVPTIYPPLSQIVFASVYAIRPGVLGMKSFLVAVDLGLICLLVQLLRGVGLPPERVVVYAWNPLVILEVAGSGHGDGLGVFLLLLAVYCLHRGKEALSAATLACSFLAKFFGGVLLPPLTARVARIAGSAGSTACGPARARRRASLYVLVFFAVAALGYLPYLGAGGRVLSGLVTYAGNWEFNGPVFSCISAAAGSPDRARFLVALAFVCVVSCLTLAQSGPLRAIFVSSGAFLVLSPTVHPWYLLWIVPLLCFFRSPAWIAFSGTVLLSYQVLIAYRSAAVWTLSPWVLWVEYVPLFVMMATEMYYHRGSGYGKLRY